MFTVTHAPFLPPVLIFLLVVVAGPADQAREGVRVGGGRLRQVRVF